MSNPFRRAARTGINLRMALIGPTGSGKTMWGLKLTGALAGDPPAVLDTESGSAKRYADTLDFDVVEMTTFAPAHYVRGIELAGEAGYKALLIDSLSHAWAGKDGALAMVDRAASKGGNNFAAWRDVTPEHHRMVDALLSAPLHLVVTMRVKTDYVMEPDPRTGKMAPRKVGLAPIQRDGLEYEFDVIADVDMDHRLTIGKTRCSALDGRDFKPDQLGELVAILRAWTGGDPMPAGPGSELDTTVTPEQFTPAAVPDDEFAADDDEPFADDEFAADDVQSTPAKSDSDLLANFLGRLKGVTETTDYDEAKRRRSAVLHEYKAALHDEGGPGRIRKGGEGEATINAKLLETLRYIQGLNDAAPSDMEA